MSFTTHKAKLNNNFTGINTEILGEAAGELKFCGLKLYLYLASNKDGYKWTLNPSVYADWLGLDYSNSKTLIDQYQKYANSYALKLKNYLCSNSSKYPEYHQCVNHQREEMPRLCSIFLEY